MIFLESEFPLCLDDFIVTLLYSLMTITNPFQLGFWPEATLSDFAKGPNLFLELLAGWVDGHLLSIWTCETVPGCWLRTRLSSTFLCVTAQIQLVATLVNIIPTELYQRVSVTIYGAPQDLCSQPVTGVSCSLDWIGGEIDELGLWLFRAVACWMGWVLCLLLMLPSLVPAQALLPLWPSGVLPGQQSCSCAWDCGWVQRMAAQLECQWLGCPVKGEQNVECWLYILVCLQMLVQWGPWVLKCWWEWVPHSMSMQDQQCTWQWWRESMEEALPNWPDSSERGPPKGSVHLLSHPGPLVLLFLNHPESDVLIILGQLFQFKDQPPLKLRPGLGSLL